jgi:arginyl-tRNA synthetase
MDLSQNIAQTIELAVKKLFDIDVVIELSVPDEQFGDFSSNVAMQLSKQLGKNPRNIAQEIVQEIAAKVAKTEVAGPGFINITVSDVDLWRSLSYQPEKLYDGQSWVVEYSCPNYFKELHAGHLYQTLIGDSLAKLIERAGATVHRTNFGGDVGLHVAKAIYGMNVLVNGEYNHNDFARVQDHMKAMPENERSTFLSASYVKGSGLYESDESAKDWITKLNTNLYAILKTDKDDWTDNIFRDIHDVYTMGRKWSRDYFVHLYEDLRVDPFEQYYPESATEARGVEKVLQGLEKGVFVRSQDAVVFEGEKFGLHTRVFITREKLPTYETKDIGLILIEEEDFGFDKRVLVTGRDQQEYMKVVWKALDQLQPGVESKMTHLTNGIIKFGDGKKMSSRLGNVTRAVDVLSAIRELVGSSGDDERDERIALGAVKYEFLKYRLGGDIAFNPEESVSLHGNSGPYLQYALVRARSILEKSIERAEPLELDENERRLVRKMGQYEQAVMAATTELQTNTLCNYLYELAGVFNQFYEKSRVVGDAREGERLTLVSRYADILDEGLGLLGIQAPERM